MLITTNVMIEEKLFSVKFDTNARTYSVQHKALDGSLYSIGNMFYGQYQQKSINSKCEYFPFDMNLNLFVQALKEVGQDPALKDLVGVVDFVTPEDILMS